MKKLGLIVIVAGIILMASCAGDDPAGPSGTLADVTGLAIGTASAGTNVVLTWNAVDDVDGYKVYFRTTTSGDWGEVADVTTTTYTHNATAAGYYTVKAYEGDNYSANNADPVNTIPNDVSTTYTIYDNYSPADKHSGFIFGFTSGTTGFASETSFEQDIYAYDLSKGDSDVWLFSGNYGTFGNGHQTYMYAPQQATYCPEYGTGTWYGNEYQLYTSDERVFLYLFDGYYAKMYDINVQPDPDSNNGTMVSFSYEIQTIQGLTLFTSN